MSLPEGSTSASTVLVTGAMGQLGKRVTEILLRRGRSVVALDLDNETTRAVARELEPRAGQPGRLVPAYVDLLDAEAVREVVLAQAPDVVVHLAAIVAPPCYRNPEFARRVNVEGTENLLQAALALAAPPSVVLASSTSVYGSRNPYLHPEPLTATTPLNPVDCYGEDKVAAEALVAGSGLPYSILRLGGIISTDKLAGPQSDYLVLIRATPRDNRLHTVDARDAALAFANAADLGSAIDGKVLLIGGNDTCMLVQREVEDSVMEAMGLGRLGRSVGLPGDPTDERGWGLTDWMDTTEAQELLAFQVHGWSETLAWIRGAQGPRRAAMRAAGPVLRPLMRGAFALQQRREKRGPYADPWELIGRTYGDEVLARR